MADNGGEHYTVAVNSLREMIEREIGERGAIPFSRYMELCLYDPERGYYAGHGWQFGKAGDFYTASDVHAVFGRLLARQFDEMWRALGRPEAIELRELGPGRGLFARDVLDWSRIKFPEFFGAVHYRLAERSPALCERLRQTLGSYLEAGKASFCAAADASSRATIVFANEFFDALPVEIVSRAGTLRVSAEAGRLLETWTAASAEEREFLDRYSVPPDGRERLEVPLLAQRSMAAIAGSIKRGFLIAIDYGYTRAEQEAGRHRGTLMTYRRHVAGVNPYEGPGELDITAHVNFTALAAAAEENGMRAEKLVTQSQFLMGIGEANQFADAFENARLPQERAKLALQLKHLVTPAGMGESFHVLVAGKAVDASVLTTLSGLSFRARS